MLNAQPSSKQLNKPIAAGAWSSTLTLARWRLSRTWFLLLVIALGLISAVMRTLGTTARQLASVLTWEQAIIYTTSVLLGVFFGSLISLTIVPALVFSSAPFDAAQDAFQSQFYTLQHIIPTKIIVPVSLGIAFAILIGICTVALGMMIRVVSKSSLSQLLRINED